MPEPRAAPRITPPEAMWPAGVPAPQAGAFSIVAPARAQACDVLYGPTRLRLKARTAPAEWRFSCWLTREQMQTFETWYRALLDLTGGEFYAPWIGGARLAAFADAYIYSPLGRGWILTARAVRTRVDPSICDAEINAIFGAVLRDDGVTADIVRDDGASLEIVRDEYPLTLIADHEC